MSGRPAGAGARWRVRPSSVAGTVDIPGDKSIAHRALLVAAAAGGVSTLRGLPSSADVASTRRCLTALGIAIRDSAGAVLVEASSFRAATSSLDAGNSGTTMRLLTGLLAPQAFDSVLDGDPSLRRRPMDRVVAPLRMMGAELATAGGRAPLRISGSALHGIRYTPPMASAQVKSAILLAGLYADGDTTVVEPIPTRDHTERLLRHAGVAVEWVGGEVTVSGGSRPRSLDVDVPGDPSSAAFPLVAAALCGTSVVVRDVAVNPGRIGFLELLDEMGCDVDLDERADRAGEPVADVRVSGRPRHAVSVGAERVPALIDELPLVALLGTAAPGTTVVHGAAELRVKESDRISTVVTQLHAMGARITEFDDGFAVEGGAQLRGAEVDACGDHRLAMLLAVAGLVASGPTTVHGADVVDVSFPGFTAVLRRLGASIDVS